MRVKEVMKSPVVTVEAEAPLRVAMALMAEHSVRHLPVVREGALVGILTDRDCRAAWASSAPTLREFELVYLLDDLRVKEAMTAKVVTVTPETPVAAAARLILEKKLGSLPVVEDREVVGIVTTTDLLTALAQVLEREHGLTPRTLLVPTDFSALSARAVEHARSLAREYGARLILLHVQRPIRVSTAEGPLPESVVQSMQAAQEQDALARLSETFPDGAQTAYRVVTGYPEVEIARLARDERADLIVMTTHRRTAMGPMLAGSVTEEVLRRAPCPVLALTS